MDLIVKAIGRARARLQQFRLLKYLAYGVMAGLAAAVLLLIAARLWPVPGYRLLAAALVLIAAAAGLGSGILHRVTRNEAASVMDAASGGVERSDMMVTALSFAGSDSPAAIWQRVQAAEYGRQFTAQLKTRLKWPKQRRLWMVCSSIFVLSLILGLLPSPMDAEIAKAAEQKQWMKDQRKKTDELAKELESQKLEPIAKKPLENEMKTLQKDLDGVKDPNKALNELEKTMKAMEKTAKQREEKARNFTELAQKMQKAPHMSSLGKSLEQGDQAKLQKAMDELKQEIKKLTPEEKKQLREALNKLAEEAAKKQDTKPLQEAMNKLDQALAQGSDPSKLDEALKQLENELAKAIAARAAAASQSSATSKLSAGLASQGLGLASQMLAAGMPVSDTWSSEGTAEQLAQADAADAEMSSDEGAGSQGQSALPEGSNGSGQGQGAGNGQGSGAGTGKGGSGNSPGKGSGAGLGQGGRDMVTTPRSFAGKGNTQSETGPLQGGGGTIQKGGISPAVDGASRPYEEVYKEYEAEAKKSLGRNELPKQMQGLVEDYFTGINPNP